MCAQESAHEPRRQRPKHRCSQSGARLLLLRYDAGRRLPLVTASARGLLHVPVCQMANIEGRLGFASERDLAAFAAWLGQAQPLPPDEEASFCRPLRIPSAPAAHLAALMI